MKSLTALRRRGLISAIFHFFSLTRRRLYVKLRQGRINRDMNVLCTDVAYMHQDDDKELLTAHIRAHKLLRRYNDI